MWRTARKKRAQPCTCRQRRGKTEDHPLAYATFEGTIPAGEYGGGTVMLWDRGTWEPVEDPAEGMTKGSMQLVFSPEEADALYAKMGPGTEASGGSAANTVAGVKRAGFDGRRQLRVVCVAQHLFQCFERLRRVFDALFAKSHRERL